MEKENSLNQTDLKDSSLPVTDEKKTLSSTVNEDDQSMVVTKKDTSAVVILEEETTSYFVVEESGVVHLKTKRVLNKESSTMVLKDRKDACTATDGKASGDDADISQDSKKEDVSLQTNETSIADTYLQLDVTDNLDAYLERERVRKLRLSKICHTVDNQSNEDAVAKDNLDEDHAETSPNEKRPKIDNSENLDGSKTSLDEADTTLKPTDVEVKNIDSSTSKNAPSINKSEPCNSEKKDNRLIWVSNVSENTKATDLKMHLATHGKVQLAKIVTNGKECFGYVVMESHEDVVNCMKNLQNSLFENKELLLSDKMPERKHERPKDLIREIRKLEKKKGSQCGSLNEGKSEKSEHRKNSDPLTLKVSEPKQRGYSEERRTIETLERNRLLRERESMERREMERKRRAMERERERERLREREKEMRRRERLENERQKQVHLELEKERKKLEYEKKMIEKQKLELLRFKRKLLSKEKENARDDSKKRRSQHEDFDRKKYVRVEEHESVKHSGMDMSESYWKGEKVKSPPSHDIYSKKTVQAICVAPPPPVLSSNYHSSTEHSRSTDRDKQWYERKEYEHRVKSYGRKPEDQRSYGIPADARHAYQEKPFSKEQYKHKEYQVVQSHNSWDGFPPSDYKDPNIPIMRNEQASRSLQRHPGYQDAHFGQAPQDYYPASNYRRVNDYYNRPVERKY